LAVRVYYFILNRAVTKSHNLLAALLTQSPEDCSLGLTYVPICSCHWLSTYGFNVITYIGEFSRIL